MSQWGDSVVRALICKVASTVEEAKAVIEGGDEYVCDFDSHKLFRKRQSLRASDCLGFIGGVQGEICTRDRWRYISPATSSFFSLK